MFVFHATTLFIFYHSPSVTLPPCRHLVSIGPQCFGASQDEWVVFRNNPLMLLGLRPCGILCFPSTLIMLCVSTIALRPKDSLIRPKGGYQLYLEKFVGSMVRFDNNTLFPF